ncbi:hypothetical protein [Hyphobacterium sp.]|uniref:hypothetical protein n=1 Tax=Hyphobacterium sp. TaxID=2004662 RepID=UPI003BAD11CC
MKPEFNVGRALGFAFEVISARPSDFILMSVWTVLYGAVFTVIQVQAIGPELSAIMSGEASATPSSGSEMVDMLGRYFAQLLPFLAVGLIISVVFEAAWLRLFVRGESLGIFPFRLGRDELMYALSGLLVILTLVVAMVTGWMATMILAVLFALGGTIGAGIGVFLGFIIMVALIAVAATVILPVPALSVLTGRVALLEGVRSARTIFWPLLASALVAVIVTFIANGLFSGLIAFTPFDQFGQMPDGSTASAVSLFGYFAIVHLISLLPASILRGVASYAALRIDEAQTPRTGAPS